MFNVFILRSSLLSNLMALVIAGIYSVYILIDTQLVLGGKNKELTLDNYVLGAMILYVDIIQLFLKILQLLGEKKKK
jgi:FtsH-binding integral membrane protein